MSKMAHFAGDIEWEGDVREPSYNAVVTLPDGAKHIIRRENQQSMFPVKNSPLFLGSSKFFLVLPEGDKEFDSFNDLMMKGLNQSRLEE